METVVLVEILVALILAGVPAGVAIWQIVRQGRQTRKTLSTDHASMREIVEDLSRDVKVTVIPTLHKHGQDIAEVKRQVDENAQAGREFQNHLDERA